MELSVRYLESLHLHSEYRERATRNSRHSYRTCGRDLPPEFRLLLFCGLLALPIESYLFAYSSGELSDAVGIIYWGNVKLTDYELNAALSDYGTPLQMIKEPGFPTAPWHVYFITAIKVIDAERAISFQAESLMPHPRQPESPASLYQAPAQQRVWSSPFQS